MRMSVAIIDDDESVCRSLVRLLQQAGLRPSAFQSAEAFLASPLRSGFGCLVLDVHLDGGMSGLELRREMLENGDLTPIIFLTAHDDFVTRSEVDCMGCAAFMRKGGNHVSLIDTLLRIERSHSA
jgi:FixJ family two-component response regulator